MAAPSVLGPNRLARAVAKALALPSFLHAPALSLLFNTTVKLAGTAGIRVTHASPTEVRMELQNRRKVQNHIGGVHACGMALLGESATGLVFGMSVPDTHVPVIKTLKVDFKKRAKGSLKAVATLTAEQIQQITSQDKGEVAVQVAVTDESGGSPIACEMVWAWVPKVRTPPPARAAGSSSAGAAGQGGGAT